VELLLKNGAEIDATDMLKMTPLHWAVERGHVTVIECLLRHGANAHLESKFEKTALDIAADNGRTDILQLLQYADKFQADGPIIEGDVSCEANKQDSPDQSSTSVLATLAALAEASGPLSAQTTATTTTADAIQWLESQGLTMLPADNSTIVGTALDGGQTISLTEAGKLALTWAKKQNVLCTQAIETENIDNTVDGTIHNVVNSINNQKVITIVTDQSQIPQLAGDGPILVAMTNSGISPTEAITLPQEERNGEPSADVSLDREQLQRRLEEARRKAEEYKEQLRMKEHEAEEYLKKLEAMAD